MRINISQLWRSLGIEDKVSLVQQLYDAHFGEELLSADIIHIKDYQAEQYIRKNPHVCGFRNEETLKEITDYKAISPIDSDRSRFPYFDKATGVNIYKIIIDWNNVANYAGFLQDHEADDQYGLAHQKQIIRDALKKIDKESQYKDLIVTEKILGKYLDHVSLAQTVRGEDSPDRHIKFVETLGGLEREGFLTMKKMQFNFGAVPLPSEEEGERLEQGVYIDEDAYFYPAEHCQITIALSDSKSAEGVLLKEEAKHAIPVEAILAAIEEDEDVREKEEFHKDEIQLVSKLLNICSPKFLDLEIVTSTELVESDQFRAGFDKQQTIDTLRKRGVFDKFEELHVQDTSHRSYKAKINYQSLLNFAEELHDEVEAVGDVYDFAIQKNILLKLINKEFDASPQEKTHTIAEWILGSYEPENRTNNPAGISLLRPDKKRPDTRFQFMHVLRALEKEKHFTIESVMFDFNAKPSLTLAAQRSRIFSGDLKEYYPPSHCKVTLTLAKTVLENETQQESTDYPAGIKKETTKEELEVDSLEKSQPSVLKSFRLVFHPDDGITEYRGSQYRFSGKTRALLTVLNKSKNTPYSLEDIKAKCNPLISNEKHYFKRAKDARDTVNYIRGKLKVNKGEFFPIEKHADNWIWLEK